MQGELPSREPGLGWELGSPLAGLLASLCPSHPTPLPQHLNSDQHTSVLLKSLPSVTVTLREKEQTVIPRSTQSPDLGRRIV